MYLSNVKFIYLLIAVYSIILACNTDLNGDEHNGIEIIHESKSYKSFYKQDFVKLTKDVIGNKDVKVISTELIEIEDNLGVFRAVKSIYMKDSIPFTTFMPLEKKSDRENSFRFYYYVKCTMTCEASNCIGGCSQTIITRCESQTCECNTPSGSCSSKITF